jgi:hypothetical protein
MGSPCQPPLPPALDVHDVNEELAGSRGDSTLRCASENQRMSVSDRIEVATVTTTRGPVEVVRQRRRSQRPRSPWDLVWLARPRGQTDGAGAAARARRSAKPCCSSRTRRRLGFGRSPALGEPSRPAGANCSLGQARAACPRVAGIRRAAAGTAMPTPGAVAPWELLQAPFESSTILPRDRVSRQNSEKVPANVVSVPDGVGRD